MNDDYVKVRAVLICKR